MITKLDELREKYSLEEEHKKELYDDMIKAGFPKAMAQICVSNLDPVKHVLSHCPTCDKTVRIEKPDIAAFDRLFDRVLAYLVGKPVERREVALSLSPGMSVSDLSREQLEAILGDEPLELTE